MAAVPFAPHDGVGAYLAQIGRLPLLTREGEVEIAKRIELGEHAVLRGLAGCEIGVRQVRLLGDRLRSGTLRARDVVRGFDEEDPTWEETERTRVLRLLLTVTRLSAKAALSVKGSGPRHTAGRASRESQEQIAETVIAMRLNQRTVDAMVRALSTVDGNDAPPAPAAERRLVREA